MRLIDEDALMDAIAKPRTSAVSAEYFKGVTECVEKITKAPTVEERPTGRWEPITVDRNGTIMGITVCTNCGKEPTFTHYYDTCGNYCLSDFCPHCGADMRQREVTE